MGHAVRDGRERDPAPASFRPARSPRSTFFQVFSWIVLSAFSALKVSAFLFPFSSSLLGPQFPAWAREDGVPAIGTS